MFLMKRVTWALLIGIALAGLFSCGGAAATGPVKLTVWAVDPIDVTNVQSAYVRALVENFQKANPNITIDWVPFGAAGSALNDKVKVAMANDEEPDVLQSWGGTFMGQFADAGKLLDMTNELADIKCSDAAKNAMSWKGKTYGIAPFFAIAVLFVNQGMFDKMNLTVPKTIAELEAVCDKLKAAGIQPLASGAMDKWPILHTYMYLVNRYGGDIFTDAVARKAKFTDEPFIQAGLKMQEWAKKGYYGTKPLAEAYGNAQTLLATGKAGMCLTGTWMCGMWSDPKQTTQTIAAYPYPILVGGKGTAEDLMGMTDVGFIATVKAQDKKDAVSKLFHYAMTVDALKAETGRVATVEGVPAPTKLTGEASAIMAKAKSVQFWWDQNLPQTMTGPVNDMVQSFLSPQTDVKAACANYEKLAEQNLGAVK
jgi:raffinose/stachyose/melibiose transport system substrate-binding protein